MFTACVSFTESSITGLDLLQRSGLVIETATNPNQGTAVCKIGDVGDASNDCFGSMPNYWSYWQLGENGWGYSAIGADQSQVVDGGVYAWSWGTWRSSSIISHSRISVKALLSCYQLPRRLPSLQPILRSQHLYQPWCLPRYHLSPTATVTPAKTGTGSYIVYASILLVLGALIIYLIRSRSK